MASSTKRRPKRKRPGRPKPFKIISRTLIFLGFIFYSLLGFDYFFEPESISSWKNVYFYAYPFVFLLYIYTFKLDMKKRGLLAIIFNISFFIVLSLSVIFVSRMFMQPDSQKNKLQLAIAVFSMCAVMLADFFMIDYFKSVFRRKSKKSPRKTSSKSGKRAPAKTTKKPARSQSRTKSSSQKSSSCGLQNTKDTVDFIYGNSSSSSKKAKSSKIMRSKDIL